MQPIEIKPNIYWIGINDRNTEMFEGLWPVHQDGVSLNSYYIADEKKVIIDLTHELTRADMLEQLNHFTDFKDIDYVVVNHMEPDHTGALLELRKLSPRVKILCSERASKMLKDFYGITEGVEPVKDGETRSIGRYTLQFISTPNLHWPETMMTLVQEEALLFSCDAFGGFGALDSAIFDDEIEDLAFFEQEALRYYTNIVAAFSKSVLAAINKLSQTPVSMVAPSHGLVWRKDPMRIISLYKQWATSVEQGGETGITLVYGTMYHDTEKMANAVARGIASEGVPYTVFDISKQHVSYILPSLISKNAVLVGAPTYEGRLFPPMSQVLDIIAIKRLRGKKTAFFGSSGWGGGARKAFEAKVLDLQWEMRGALEFLGNPSQEQLREGEAFGAEFARSLKEKAAV